MSGPLGSQQWMYSTGFYPYEIDKSARLDTNSYYQRTPSSSGSRTTWTWNAWVKLGSIGQTEVLFTARTAGQSANGTIGFEAGKLFWDEYDGSSNTLRRHTTQVFRDPSAWYMITIVADTTNATASNRGRVYINGSQVTDFSVSVNPAQSAVLEINQNITHRIGANSNNTQYFNGYLAEVNFIDGQALDPTDFGEFKSGVWIPKSYSGSYGTNGFYLDFGNSGSLGADSSGNGNNWTPTNLAATDQVSDSPTNNFATMNFTNTFGDFTLSEGNLKVSTANVGKSSYSTMAVPASGGKYYAEVYLNSQANSTQIGIANIETPNSALLYSQQGVSYYSVTGNAVADNGAYNVSYGDSYTTGDVIGIALDMDAGTLIFYKNGVSQGTAYTGLQGANTSFYFAVSDDSSSSNSVYTLNFGQDSSFAGNKTAQGNTDANGIGDFYYAPPSGYLALCTANLPDPAIDPALDDVPEDYFNTVLWTGDGTTSRDITGVGFQPDWVWYKKRSAAFDHNSFDAVRGAGKLLEPSTTAAESTTSDRLNGFVSDGFNVGNNSGVNASGATYVAWNWLAGNGTSTNTDGTITSTVSANQKAGFSIATYTGNSSNLTLGHGLGVAPAMYIIKWRSNASQWYVYHKSLGANKYLQLNLTAVAQTDAAIWQNTDPTSSLIYVGSGITGTQDAVCYAFAEVEGFSKFGSYTGNGSTDGPFVYTGFRPAFVMVKGASFTSDWWINDSVRSTYNQTANNLVPNSSGAEYTGNDFNSIDILSNGFKLRNTNTSSNASGYTYIFACFSEMPFKYSNAR